ncbi:nucleoside recognition domain-containing protein [candidate division KSB1 bacterium]
MINIIWLLLIVIAVATGAVTGNMQSVTNGAFDGAKLAVEIAIGLIGVMALFLGLMKIAEEAGFVQFLARLVRPVMTRLFPDVPADHPAMGAMLLNMSANALGLGNAATPLGLKAMKELQSLNPYKDQASNAMATFLAINTSDVTIIPATVIGIRSSAGSMNSAEIIGTTIIATICSTTAAIIAAKTLQRMRAFRIVHESNETAE